MVSGVTRIVAGEARGRRLAIPSRGTRPTADRTREGLFSALGARVGSTGVGPGGYELAGLRFLDLYAGSGAVGLEALSRGAVSVALVERDRAAAAVIEANIATVGLPGAVVHCLAVERIADGPAPVEPFDVVFADPPYDLSNDELGATLSTLAAAGWFASDALVVVERPTRVPWTWPPEFITERERRYGEATLWYGRAAG